MLIKSILFVAFLFVPAFVEAAVPVITQLPNATAVQGATYTASPVLTAGGTVKYTKEYGPDEMTVNSTTGAVTWTIPSNLARESFNLGIKATNSEGSTVMTWVLTVGGGTVRYVGSGQTYTNIAAACSAATSGDTIIIKDGTYTGTSNILSNGGNGNSRGTLPPSGSSGIYTTVIAEHPGGVILDGQAARALIDVTGNYSSRDTKAGAGDTVGTYNASYLAFKGLVVGNSDSACVFTNHASHIKFIDLGVYDAADGNTAPMQLFRSEYLLVEGCYVWGNGRMRIVAYICDYSIFRRNVARHDRSNASEPIGLYDIYSCQHTRVQNNIAIDSDQYNYFLNYTDSVGAFIDQSGSSNGETWSQRHDNTFWSNIALNIHNDFSRAQARTDSDAVSFNNMIGWDINAIPAAAGDDVAEPQLSIYDLYSINQCTFGKFRSPHVLLNDYGISGGLTVNGWQQTQTVKNSIFYDFKNYDNSLVGLFYDIDSASYNNIYGTGTITTHGTAPTNTITANPTTSCLKYLPRIESGCSLQTAGASGVRVGANIMTMRGKSGTLFGETGYDDETSVSMWPFPHEDLIKSKMAAYTYTGAKYPSGTGTITGARGFCTGTSKDGTSQTLTKYIWEYLGYQIPADIYGTVPVFGPPPQNPSAVKL